MTEKLKPLNFNLPTRTFKSYNLGTFYSMKVKRFCMALLSMLIYELFGKYIFKVERSMKRSKSVSEVADCCTELCETDTCDSLFNRKLRSGKMKTLYCLCSHGM